MRPELGHLWFPSLPCCLQMVEELGPLLLDDPLDGLVAEVTSAGILARPEGLEVRARGPQRHDEWAQQGQKRKN